MNDSKQHDDEAVSSVVGEMIMIALVVILVALFATSAFSLVPGGREASVDVVMKNESNSTNVQPDDTVLFFWHKGGDWVEKKDLTVLVIGKDGKRNEYTDFFLYGYDDVVRGDVFDDSSDSGVKAFDLGGCLKVDLDAALKCGDIVRLVTPKTVIYSGEIREAKQP